MNKVPYIISENSITIFWEGKPYTLRKDNVNFQLAKKAIIEARYDDLGDLLDIKKAVENFIEGDIEVKDEVVYYKNHRLHGVVVDKLLEMLRAGMKDSAPLTNFISRLQANPSANSVNELYSFMSYKSLANTHEGKVLGYKGVQSDYWSTTGNADTIVLQGKTNDRHQILNEVGATIEVARRCVDDNKDNHCSFGLHVGSFDYANEWAGENGKLLLVEFDPADAVSVPTDCDFQKLRVSKYKVISDITDTRKELNKPVYQANQPIYGSDNDDEDFGEDDSDNDDFDYVDDESYDCNSESCASETCECEDSGHIADNTFENQEMIELSIRNYIENKHELGIDPTIKNVADLKVCRNNSVRCKEIAHLVEKLGFEVEDNEDKIFSDLQIYEL